MKKVAWLCSVLLLFVITWHTAHMPAPLQTLKQRDTKQYTTKQEVTGTNAVKGSFQLQHTVTTPQTTSFSPYALLLGNRLVDVAFTVHYNLFTQLKSILFSPTFLRLRVLRL